MEAKHFNMTLYGVTMFEIAYYTPVKNSKLSRSFYSENLRLKCGWNGWFQPRAVEMRLKNFQPCFNRFNRISTEPGNFWRERNTFTRTTNSSAFPVRTTISTSWLQGAVGSKADIKSKFADLCQQVSATRCLMVSSSNKLLSTLQHAVGWSLQMLDCLLVFISATMSQTALCLFSLCKVFFVGATSLVLQQQLPQFFTCYTYAA